MQNICSWPPVARHRSRRSGSNSFRVVATPAGINVDARSRTVTTSIYAVGDAAAGRPRLTSTVAGASLAVRDMFARPHSGKHDVAVVRLHRAELAESDSPPPKPESASEVEP